MPTCCDCMPIIPMPSTGLSDSDYVFVNLFGRPHGQPLGYAAVYDLVRRLRRCTGITFGPHMFRHTYATWLLRRGAGMESVKELLGHASITTRRHLWSSDGRGRAAGVGGRRMVHRSGGAVVTAEAAWSQQVPAGLLEKLMTVVRPQFRVDVYLPDPDDPVLGRPLCCVPDCDRSRAEGRLCSGHGRRWRVAGCPDLPAFLTDPGPPLPGWIELTACTVEGCRYGVSGLGLRMRHRDRRSHSGDPDPAAWAAGAPRVVDPLPARLE